MSPINSSQFPIVERLPPYVLGVVVQKMNELRKAGADVIDLGMGNPDMPSPDFVVQKLIEAAQKPKNHRYSVSRGIPKLRQAMCAWYKRHYDVDLNFDSEVIATMGAKEGLSHLIMAITKPGDVIMAPNPTYPIHSFAPVIAGANVRDIRCDNMDDFFNSIERSIKTILPRPKVLITSFPSNPTGHVVDLDFFKELVRYAKENDLIVIHDLAYADICFDGYKAPSILQVPGAKDVAVELYSMSKGYNMPGWRVAFTVGNKQLIEALKKIKSYLDYGMFQPIQIAATVALNEGDAFVRENCAMYQKRRDVFVEGINAAGWPVPKPKATMFVWAKIPEKFDGMSSLDFTQLMLTKALVCCSPGIGFGQFGEGYVRFALVENEKRLRQAVRGIKNLFK
jgi:alanine-synthesizing transaminase